jgi:hypothetical protein
MLPPNIESVELAHWPRLFDIAGRIEKSQLDPELSVTVLKFRFNQSARHWFHFLAGWNPESLTITKTSASHFPDSVPLYKMERLRTLNITGFSLHDIMVFLKHANAPGLQEIVLSEHASRLISLLGTDNASKQELKSTRDSVTAVIIEDWSNPAQDLFKRVAGAFTCLIKLQVEINLYKAPGDMVNLFQHVEDLPRQCLRLQDLIVSLSWYWVVYADNNLLPSIKSLGDALENALSNVSSSTRERRPAMAVRFEERAFYEREVWKSWTRVGGINVA